MNSCLECKDPNSVLTSESKCECKKGFQKNDENGLCSPCNYSCKTCNKEGFCLSCKDNYQHSNLTLNCECLGNLIVYNGGCICPQGFKFINDSCLDYYFSFNVLEKPNGNLHIFFASNPLQL